ncbi:hypothetical protein COE94_09570 [Bacillus toyonensis]|nr:hypothetical protein CN603_24435 [Bacillus toyonensis]PHB86844.1 hypothetical protein COE94_09570 [Bacillus toyonensis]
MCYFYEWLQKEGIVAVPPQGVNKRNNHHIFIILQFSLILNIEIIITKYIYIEKFITKLVRNDSKLQCKLSTKSLLSFPHKH